VFKRTSAHTYVQDLLLFTYLIFIYLFCILIIMFICRFAFMMGPFINATYLTKSLCKGTLSLKQKTVYHKTKSICRFAFMMGPFINATFPIEWYNGDAMSNDELVFFFMVFV
jgi:hypothetical protein